MTTIRRTGALALAGFILAAVAAAPVSAEGDTVVTSTAPEVYAASASGRALDLALLGTRLTIGSSGAVIDSTPKAEANGAGVLLVGGTVSQAAVTGPDQSQDPAPACLLNLPVLDLVDLKTLCGDTAVSTAGGLPQAHGAGSVAELGVGLSLLQPILDQLLALTGQTIGSVTNVVDPLLGGLLNPLLGTLGLTTENLVDDLITRVQQATGVLRVQLGRSTADAVAATERVSAVGLAEGARIDVLPGLGPAVISIIVGQAQARVDVQRPAPGASAVTATATPTFNASIVTVEVLGSPIPVGLGQPITLFAGTPLESTISLGAGRTVTNPDGSVAAIADGVSIELLKGLSGGIALQLAHAEAAGGGKSAVIVTQKRAVTPVPEQLAKTGQDEPWLPVVGAGVLMAAYLSRRLVVRARA